MAQTTLQKRRIDANENDLKNNRLGLMSQGQIRKLQKDIDVYQARIKQIIPRAITVGLIMTVAIVLLVLMRILVIPVAVVLEALVVGGMIYLTTDFNHFIQQLMMDRDAGAVRIIKGRTSRYTMRSHPLYQTLRIEVQNYKVQDISLLRQFENGELYQVYVLPQSRLVISAEKISESGAGALL